MAELRHLAIGADGVEDGTNEYGTFFRVEGELVGPGGRALVVVTVWLRWHVDGSFPFVTLKPPRRLCP